MKLILQTLIVLSFLTSSAIQADTGIKVIKTYKVGAAPHGMRPVDSTVWVALSGEDAIVRINLQNGNEVSRWPVSGTPLDIVRSNNGWLVSTFGGEDLIELHGLTGKEVSRWHVGKSPSLFTENPRHESLSTTGFIYIPSEFSDRLTVFDGITNQIVKSYKTGSRPYPVDVTYDGVLAFVPNRDDNSVSVIDLLNEKEVAKTAVCKSPEGGALVEGENIYMVACGGSDEIALINTASFEVIDTIKDGIGKRPFSVLENTDGRYAFVNNAGGDTISVIDIAKRKVVDEIKVGKQPIVMRVEYNRFFDSNEKLFVSNEVSGTLSVLEIPKAPKAPIGTAKNEVVVLGMIHGRHNNSKTYGLPYLTRVFEAVNPDIVLVEIPPNRMEATMKGFHETGEITETRAKRFPEYVGALFPLSTRMNFEMIGTAGWNSHMDEYRRKALLRIENDPTRAEQWSEHEERLAHVAKLREGLEEDPYYINSDTYDTDTRTQLEAYQWYFEDDLGTGGWETINGAHYGHIANALDQLKGQGKRIMITYGAGHKYWFLEQLQMRDDITLLDPHQFLDAAKE